MDKMRDMKSKIGKFAKSKFGGAKLSIDKAANMLANKIISASKFISGSKDPMALVRRIMTVIGSKSQDDNTTDTTQQGQEREPFVDKGETTPPKFN
jgi:hypothetical protein